MKKVVLSCLVFLLVVLSLFSGSTQKIVYCDRCPTCDAPGLFIGKVPMGAQYVVFYHDTNHFWWCAYVDGKLKTEVIHIQ